MRLDAFEIRNYRGVALAAAEELAAKPVIVLSGKNGTGKSMVLEALVFCWAQRYGVQDRVGPWADEATIEIAIGLSETELAVVAEWHERTGRPAPDPSGSYTYRRTFN